MIAYPFRFQKIGARFIRRLNRFVVQVDVEGKESLAYLPNPGRLWELLIKDTELIVFKNSESKKIPYTVLFCKKDNQPVLLHTHLTNQIVKALIEEKRIDFLKDYQVDASEVRYKNSRFDLLLKNLNEKFFLEVKTCTLFGNEIAMFPDAPSERATKHLLNLKELKAPASRAGCLFVVMNPHIKYFFPAYHIDMTFSRTLFSLHDDLEIKAVALDWDSNLTEVRGVSEILIPWQKVKKKLNDSGVYLLVIRVSRDVFVSVGTLGEISFRKGYYVYAGSAKKNLSKRISRHKRINKQKHWHIDYLIDVAKVEKDIAFITDKDLECELAKEVEALSDGLVEKFGSSDCRCRSHLYFFKHNPFENKKFIEIITKYRIDMI